MSFLENELGLPASFIKIFKRIILTVIVLVILLFGTLGSFYTIDAGDKGVVRRFGEVVTVADAGLHFKVPVIDTVTVISTRQQTLVYKDEQRISTYTRDQQNAYLGVSFTFNVTDPVEVYKSYGSTEAMVNQLILPGLSAEAEGEMSKYKAADAVENRDALWAAYGTRVKEYFKGKPIIVNSVVLLDLSFDKKYEDTVSDMVAKNVEEKKRHKELDIEKINAEINRTKAQGEADAAIIQAKAHADKLKLQGEAEAAVIKIKSEALEKQGVNLINLTIAEKWSGVLPTTMTPDSAVPMLNLNLGKEAK